MRAMSPQRRLSITRNTNYPSLVHERRPSEIGYQSQANIKNMSQEHETSRNRMEKIHMKSITELDNQRKHLEKSMLAYTEKMKEMMDHRTNHLFRGIQIRLADVPDKTGPRSLPASVDLCDTTSTVSGNSPVDSAKLRRRRILVSRKSGILTDRHEIKTPIDEEREIDIKQSKPSRRIIRPNSANLWRQSTNGKKNTDAISVNPRVRYSSPDIFTSAVKHQLTGRRFTKAIEEENETVNYKMVELEIRRNIPDNFRDSAPSSNNSSVVNSADSKRKNARGDILTTPTIHIQADKTENTVVPGLQRERSFIEGLSNDSDSAYSSCNEDDDGWTTADSGSVSDCGSDSSNKSKRKVRFVDPNPLDGNLLTVPKVYKRKRSNSKGKLGEKENSDTLLKKAILKNAALKS